MSYALALEAVARASAVLSVIASVNNSLVAEPIAEFGTEAQQQTWLRRLATGGAIGSFALSEEQAGSDAANQQTAARLDDGGYVLSGRKVWVANAEAGTSRSCSPRRSPAAEAAGSARSSSRSTRRG